jgi:phosphatidylinositol dimannoside acyltransferase
VNDRAVEWAYAAAWSIARSLPAGTANSIFRIGADRAVRRGEGGSVRLAENLRVVVGDDMPEDQFQQLVRDAMRSYARYWCDAFRLPSNTPEQNRTAFTLHGHEVLLENCAAGRGTVLGLPHGGNWDAAGAWVASMGMPITTVAERLKPESLYDRFVAFREGLGMEILPLTGGERPALDVLSERVATGTVVPLLADRDFSRTGVPVTFFGRRTRMPAGPAILAIQGGVPLYTVDMYYEPAGPVGLVSEPIPLPPAGSLKERVAALTQSMADNFEAGVRRHPADWHMLAKMFVPEKAMPVLDKARLDKAGLDKAGLDKCVPDCVPENAVKPAGAEA